MCILALAWRAHPRWSLVLAANRDEFHERPAAALARWDEAPGIIAGRDLRSGGTWLGVREADAAGPGRLAVVTNLRGFGDPVPERPSRGALVLDVLRGAGRFSAPDAAGAALLNPFNLIHADPGGATILSNRPATARWTLTPGIYGLSNGALDAPWPKTLRLKAAMRAWIAAGAEAPERLFAALAEDALPEAEAAAAGMVAGVATRMPSDVAAEPPQTPVFIRDPVYGTRCSTIVAIDDEGAGWIGERRFSAAGDVVGESAFGFAWV